MHAVKEIIEYETIHSTEVIVGAMGRTGTSFILV